MSHKTVVLLAIVVGMLCPGAASASGTPATGSSSSPEVKVSVTLKAKAFKVTTINKRCRAAASRRDAPSRPADPRAFCRGLVRATGNPSVRASCPPGWFGGVASSRATIVVRLTVEAFAESFARISRVRAATRIKGKASSQVKAQVNCVRVSPPPPPPVCPDGNPVPPEGCYPPPPRCPDGRPVPPEGCYPPPPPCYVTNTCPPSVAVTGWININDVPEGKSSGPMAFSVNASHTGSVTVTADLGSVSSCSGTTGQVSVTFTLAPGNNSLCVIYYAPGEASVMQDTITYTAIVTNAGATARDVKSDVFAITHPQRP